MSVEFKDDKIQIKSFVPDISKDELAEWIEIKTKLEILKNAIERGVRLSWGDNSKLTLGDSSLAIDTYMLLWPSDYESIVRRLNEEKNMENANE